VWKAYTVQPFTKYGWYKNARRKKKIPGPNFGYKCIHKEAPKYIDEFFKINICNYNLRGLGTILTLPNFNPKWRHKSLSFLSAKLWNLLPRYVRNAKDISTFKCLLKKQVLR